MTIFALQQVKLINPATVEDQIGRALYLRSMHHFVQYLGHPGVGISYESCNAAVAVTPNAQYDQVSLNGGAQMFSVVYGSSRLYTGLDPDFNRVHQPAPGRPFSSSVLEEHAEQSAIRIALAQGLPFWMYNGRCHIYIDLTPCDNCHVWLDNRGENWYVHYRVSLDATPLVTKEKKRLRADEFGRQMEPRIKKAKT